MDQPIILVMSLIWLLAIKHGQPDEGDITRFYSNITCIIKNDYFIYYFALIMDSHDAHSVPIHECVYACTYVHA